MSHLINYTRVNLFLLYFADILCQIITSFYTDDGIETFKKYDPDLRVYFLFPSVVLLKPRNKLQIPFFYKTRQQITDGKLFFLFTTTKPDAYPKFISN